MNSLARRRTALLQGPLPLCRLVVPDRTRFGSLGDFSVVDSGFLLSRLLCPGFAVKNGLARVFLCAVWLGNCSQTKQPLRSRYSRLPHPFLKPGDKRTDQGFGQRLLQPFTGPCPNCAQNAVVHPGLNLEDFSCCKDKRNSACMEGEGQIARSGSVPFTYDWDVLGSWLKFGPRVVPSEA